MDPPVYEIVIEGYLASHRLGPYDELKVTHRGDGLTAILAPIPDQPALYGLLDRLRDLGAVLVSVQRTRDCAGLP